MRPFELVTKFEFLIFVVIKFKVKFIAINKT